MLRGFTSRVATIGGILLPAETEGENTAGSSAQIGAKFVSGGDPTPPEMNGLTYGERSG